MTLTPKEITSFRKHVYQYYKDHGRDLPWRKNITPYKIFISEVMLQQTQVDRVIGKFKSFIKRFPSFKALAEASIPEVLEEWQGLGYNRRALMLKKAAEMVHQEYKGKLPQNRDELIKLPGIGEATSGSLAVYAYNKPEVYIETNIRAVYIHHFFKNTENVHDKKLIPLIEQTLDKEKPFNWYSALMDYGTILKKSVTNPSRKSKHYVKQSTFEGSNRQLRGQVLKILLAEKKSTIPNIVNLSNRTEEEVTLVCTTLTKEGFVKQQGKYYLLQE